MISIKKGDSTILTETITGLSSLAGYTAKMYIVNDAEAELDTLDGVIAALTITYEIFNEASKLYPVGIYNFETKIWDASDHVYTASEGKFIVKKSIEDDPS